MANLGLNVPSSRGSPASKLPPHVRDYWLNASDALFTVVVEGEDDFIFGDFNPAALRMTGLPRSAVRGHRPADILPPASAAEVIARYRRCVREGQPITYVETLNFPTGASSYNTTLSPIADAEGRVVCLVGSARPVPTPELSSQLAEHELRAVLDGLPNGIALLDGKGVIVFANAAWRRFAAHYGVPHYVGDSYLRLCGFTDRVGLPERSEVEPLLRPLLEGETQHFSLRYAWRDRRLLLRGSRLSTGGAVRVALAHADVTAVVAAQEVLARASEHLLQVQEEERARIAQELHDSTSQHLVAVGLGLARLRKSKAPPEILDDMRRALGEAYREIRTLTYLLYPPKLSSQGLEASLRTFIEGFRRRTGLSIATAVFGELEQLPLDMQRTVYRVVQESLANVHRHAHARRVAIDISVKARGLKVTVVDDGRHGKESGDVAATGVGIRGMQARFASYGGELTVAHRPFGTVVEGSIPTSAVRRAAAVSG